MTDNFWKDKYPVGVESEINPDEYRNVQAVLKASCERFADKPAFSNLGRTLTYGELYELSGEFAAYLQHHTDLQPGDRIAVQLPNLLQYPVVVFGALRAGLIVVNTNPLYTAREMEHQFNDSGAKALVCLANMAHLAEEVVPKTGIRHVVITEVGDMLPTVKRLLVNAVIKHVKKMVPSYDLPKAVKLNDALAQGRNKRPSEADPESDDIAVLQYTGGTTGVAKGAMLTHRNLVSNMLQCRGLMGTELGSGCETMVAPLPLYHIYAFTFHCMTMMLIGATGELCVKGPQGMKGYWQRPEATAEVLDGQGWLKTGDIGIIQDDGYMRIVDRKKDMILVSGFNVYPNELEDVLATLPGVLQCAAIGIPDEKSGEAIKLFVVVKPGESLTKEQVMQHMHDNVTGYKRPKTVEFRDSLPTTNVGKILRRELRDEELRKLGKK